jgi:hypothetical protein
MSPTSAPITITTIGIDLGKNTFHLVDLDRRGAIVSQLSSRAPRSSDGLRMCRPV